MKINQLQQERILGGFLSRTTKVVEADFKSENIEHVKAVTKLSFYTYNKFKVKEELIDGVFNGFWFVYKINDQITFVVRNLKDKTTFYFRAFDLQRILNELP